MVDLVKLAQIAANLAREADELLETVRESIASSKEALSTTDKSRLSELLEEARTRRQAADKALDDALDALLG